jgi:hypothetical protein
VPGQGAAAPGEHAKRRLVAHPGEDGLGLWLPCDRIGREPVQQAKLVLGERLRKHHLGAKSRYPNATAQSPSRSCARRSSLW